MIIINPSILSADFSNLQSEFEKVNKSNTNMIHLDIMDGVFVPNITFGPPVVKKLRNISSLIFDVHLMITNPIKYIKDFAEAGADIISFHYEACSNPREVIDEIKKYGKKAAIAINPNTKVEAIYQYLNDLDMVLIMTVYPGFGGQKLIVECLEKINKLRNYLCINNLNVDIEVDGGINSETIIDCTKNGANIIVSGSTLFNSDNFNNKLNELKTLANNNYRG